MLNRVRGYLKGLVREYYVEVVSPSANQRFSVLKKLNQDRCEEIKNLNDKVRELNDRVRELESSQRDLAENYERLGRYRILDRVLDNQGAAIEDLQKKVEEIKESTNA